MGNMAFTDYPQLESYSIAGNLPVYLPEKPYISLANMFSGVWGRIPQIHRLGFHTQPVCLSTYDPTIPVLLYGYCQVVVGLLDEGVLLDRLTDALPRRIGQEGVETTPDVHRDPAVLGLEDRVDAPVVGRVETRHASRSRRDFPVEERGELVDHALKTTGIPSLEGLGEPGEDVLGPFHHLVAELEGVPQFGLKCPAVSEIDVHDLGTSRSRLILALGFALTLILTGFELLDPTAVFGICHLNDLLVKRRGITTMT